MNAILKQGDLVKYHSQNDTLDALGYKLGLVYEVKELDGLILAKQGPVLTPLLDRDGEPSQWSDYFSKHYCPVILPRGKAG